MFHSINNFRQLHLLFSYHLFSYHSEAWAEGVSVLCRGAWKLSTLLLYPGDFPVQPHTKTEDYQTGVIKDYCRCNECSYCARSLLVNETTRFM